MHGGAPHPRHTLDGFGHVPRAISAGHARNGKLRAPGRGSGRIGSFISLSKISHACAIAARQDYLSEFPPRVQCTFAFVLLPQIPQNWGMRSLDIQRTLMHIEALSN